MKDCFGVEYEVARMPGNGLCGYSAMAYALTGDKRQYAVVIKDLIKAFYANPHLFVQQTEFARFNPNLSQYHKEMLQAVDGVHRQSVGRLLWMEDAHLVTFSLLYDVTVFVFDGVCRKWHVYGDGAQRGYICLLSSGGHFDVLQGMRPLKPVVPREAERQGLNRETMVWHQVQVDVNRYSYAFVSSWDDESTEVVNSDTTSSPLRASYADIVKRRSPVVVSATVNTVVSPECVVRSVCHQDPPVSTTTLSIACSVCGKKCVSKRALRDHFGRMHRADTACDDGVPPDTQDTGDTESIYSEKTCVNEAKECVVDAECETVTVEMGECSESGESVTEVSEVGSEWETVSVPSSVLHNPSEVDCVESVESGVTAGQECDMEFLDSVESGQSQKERGVDVACQTEAVECVESCGGVTNERKTCVESETHAIEKDETGMCVKKECRTGNDCVNNLNEVTSNKSTWTAVKAKLHCSVCSKEFKVSRALNVHMTKMHSKTGAAKTNKEQSSKHPIPSKNSSNTIRTPFKCLLCDKAFSSKQALSLHIRRTHRYLNFDDDAGQQCDVDRKPDTKECKSHNSKVRKFPCSDCKKVFQSLRTLKLHETSKHKLYTCTKLLGCDICNITFVSQQGLDKHKEKSHPVVISAANDSSQALLVSTDNISKEYSSADVTETTEVFINAVISKQFCCSICSKEFSTSNGMRIHTSRMHKKNVTAKTVPTIVPKKSVERKATKHSSTTNKGVTKTPTVTIPTVSEFSSINELYKKYPPLELNQLKETNSMLEKLKAYHDKLLKTVDNVSTEKITKEVRDVIRDIDRIDGKDRKYTWNDDDINRLYNLNSACLLYTSPSPRD